MPRKEWPWNSDKTQESAYKDFTNELTNTESNNLFSEETLKWKSVLEKIKEIRSLGQIIYDEMIHHRTENFNDPRVLSLLDLKENFKIPKASIDAIRPEDLLEIKIQIISRAFYLYAEDNRLPSTTADDTTKAAEKKRKVDKDNVCCYFYILIVNIDFK